MTWGNFGLSWGDILGEHLEHQLHQWGEKADEKGVTWENFVHISCHNRWLLATALLVVGDLLEETRWNFGDRTEF